MQFREAALFTLMAKINVYWNFLKRIGPVLHYFPILVYYAKHTCFLSTERFCWYNRNALFPIKTNVGSGVCVGSDNISDKYSKLLHFSHFCLLSQQSYQKLMNLTAIFGLLRLPCQKWKFRKLWQNKAKFLGQVLCQA